MSIISEDQIIADTQRWLEWEVNPDYRQKIQSLLDAKDFQELAKLFYPRISFGTAGLRAAMAPGPHNMNEVVVIQASQGLAKYVRRHQASKGNEAPSAVIGFDARYHSEEFAKLTAAVFLHEGFEVYLFNKIVATPFVPFAIKQLNASCGVMVTASHNPKDDNGYKVYWENSAQIIPPHDVGIAEAILENLEPWDCKFDPSHPNLKDETESLLDKYFQSIRAYSYRPNEENSKHPLGVVYTAMHGVGAPFVTRAFQEFGLPEYSGVQEQLQPDPEFPTVAFPNPEEGKGSLLLAFQQARTANSAPEGQSPELGPRFRVIMANDPDADRLAIAELQVPLPKDGEVFQDTSEEVSGNWRVLNGNEIAVLFADWIWQRYAEKHPEPEQRAKAFMLSSTVSSAVLGAMAEAEGFRFQDTLTGFKWMGNVADDLIQQGQEFLFAFEVEIGFLIGDISLDKDGIRTAPVFNELAQHWYSRGLRLSDRLVQLQEKYGYFEMETGYYFCPTTDVLNGVFEQLRPEHEDKVQYPETLDGLKIKAIRDLTLGADTSKPDGKSVLPATPDAQMITFYLEEGVVTLRNSGTEPKLKFYVECMDKHSKERARELTDRLTAAMVKEFLKPQVNGLLTKDEMQALLASQEKREE